MVKNGYPNKESHKCNKVFIARITSYNVCYTKLLRAAQTICSDETLLQGNNASPGTGVWTVSGVGGATSQAVFTDNASPTTKVSSLGQGVNALKCVITSYSIHYTKLYD